MTTVIGKLLQKMESNPEREINTGLELISAGKNQPDVYKEQIKVEPDGSYVSLKLPPESVVTIAKIIESSGIQNAMDPQDYHLTLFFSKDKVINNFVPQSDPHPILFEKVGVLGDYLVLHFVSKSILDRFQEIKDVYGAEHSFPDLMPHISIKKNPVDGDIAKVGTSIADIAPSGTFILQVLGEVIESIK